MSNFISDSYNASVQNVQDTLGGVSYGLSGLYASGQIGMQKMMGDIGSIMPAMAPQQMHPFMNVHHGMFAHEMTFMGDLVSPFGIGAPKTSSLYEYQELAARDMGERVGSALSMGTLYGTGALASWHLGDMGLRAGYSLGSKALKATSWGAKASKGIASGARMLGFSARTAVMAGGALGGIAGAAVGLLPAIAAGYAVDKVAGDVADHQDVMNFLEASSFRYATGSGKDIDSVFGAGFNTRARSNIASAIKKIDINDSSMNMGDLKGILESGTELGLFTGANNVEEFTKKFKDLTSTLKQVTRTLHTSLEEGMKVIKELKDQGFRTPSEVSSIISTADVLGTASGKTAAEMLSIGRQGSEMVRGTGVAMASGSKMMMNNYSMITQMQQSGNLSEELIQQAGGVGNLAAGITGSNLNFMRSAFGRGVLLSMSNADGTLNSAAISKVAGGGASLQDLYGMASNNVTDPSEYVKQVINSSKNIRELSTKFGGMGLQVVSMGAHLSTAKAIQQSLGSNVSMEEALRLVMTQEGLSESEIESQIGFVKNADSFKENQLNAMRITANKQVSNMIANRTNLGGRLDDVITKATAPITEGITSFRTSMAEASENILRRANKFINKNLWGVDTLEVATITDSELSKIQFNQDIMKRGISLSGEVGKHWTAEDLQSFQKSDSFEKLNEQFIEKAVSASGTSGSLEDFSTNVTGKNWKDLNREEQMYISSVAGKLGMTKVKEEISQKKIEESSFFNKSGMKTIEQIQSEKSDAQGDLRISRNNAYNKIAVAYGDVIAKGVEKGKIEDVFDKSIQTKAELEEINAQLAGGNISGTKREELEAERDYKSKVLAGYKADIIGSIRQHGGVRGEYAADAFSKDFDRLSGSSLQEMSKSIKNKKDKVANLTGEEKYYTAIAEATKALKASDVSKLTSDEASEFRTGLGSIADIIEGKPGADIGDLKRMIDLSSKSGNVAVSGLLQKASEIHKAGKDGITDMAQIRSILKVDDSVTNEAITKKIGSSLDYKEFLNISGLNDLKQGMGMTMMSDSSSTEMEKQERDIINGLVKANSEIAQILKALTDAKVQLKGM